MAKNKTSWLESLNEDLSVSALSGIVGENSLIPLWDLLPTKYDDKREELQKVFVEQCEENYDEICNLYKLNKERNISIIYDETEGSVLNNKSPYTDGDSVELIAKPKSGYYFDGWYKGGELVSDSTTYSFTIHVNTTLEARFTEKPLEHVHTYSEEWDYDENYHWHNASCEHTTLTKDKSEHDFYESVIPPESNKEGYTLHTCSTCGYFYKDNEVIQDGTKDNPYLISTIVELNSIRNKDSKDKVVYFKLINDIDLKGANWICIDEFYGHIDGQGYTISNININDSYAVPFNSNTTNVYSGFILQNCGTIENLKIDNLNLNIKYTSSSNLYISMFVGSFAALNSGLINNVEVTNSSIKATNVKEVNKTCDTLVRVGGIAGINGGEISFAKISSSSLIAIAESNNNYSTYTSTGGIVGLNGGKCHNIIVENINVTSKSVANKGTLVTYSGYVFGENGGVLEYCVCNNENSTISTEKETTNSNITHKNCIGLISGNHIDSGSMRYTFCLSDGLRSACGNTSSYDQDIIKSKVNEIESYVILWDKWNYDGNFKFTA